MNVDYEIILLNDKKDRIKLYNTIDDKEGILVESFYLIPLGYVFYLLAFFSFLILASKSLTKLSKKIFTNFSTVESLKRTPKK